MAKLCQDSVARIYTMISICSSKTVKNQVLLFPMKESRFVFLHAPLIIIYCLTIAI